MELQLLTGMKEEHKRKISEALKRGHQEGRLKSPNFWLGKKRSEATKEKIRKAHFKGGTLTKEGYLRAKIDGKLQRVHRWVWEQHHGKIPEGHVIHHLNGSKTDNRVENLKAIEHGEHSRLTMSYPKIMERRRCE